MFILIRLDRDSYVLLIAGALVEGNAAFLVEYMMSLGLGLDEAILLIAELEAETDQGTGACLGQRQFQGRAVSEC